MPSLIIFTLMLLDLHDGRNNNKRQYLNCDADKLAAVGEGINVRH